MAKSPQDLVQENPNASVAASAGALVTVGIWVATALGLDVPPEVAAAVTTLVAAGVVFIGKRRKDPPVDVTTFSRPTT